MSHYQLVANEVIILRKEYVYIYGSLDCTADVVLLTTKNLVVEYETGFLITKNHVDVFPLSDISLYKNTPQVKMSEHYDEPVFEIQFSNAHLLLDVTDDENKKKQKQCIEEWVNKTLDAFFDLTGTKTKENGTIKNVSSRCKSCGKTLPINAAFCSSCGTKVSKEIFKDAKAPLICKNCGKEVAYGMNFCTECGTAVKNEVYADIPISANQNETLKTGVEAKPKEKLSIDQQIDLLQKLKALVDAGILSKEEFEEKKKDIL